MLYVRQQQGTENGKETSSWKGCSLMKKNYTHDRKREHPPPPRVDEVMITDFTKLVYLPPLYLPPQVPQQISNLSLFTVLFGVQFFRSNFSSSNVVVRFVPLKFIHVHAFIREGMLLTAVLTILTIASVLGGLFAYSRLQTLRCSNIRH
jgi:hypothetical protein